MNKTTRTIIAAAAIAGLYAGAFVLKASAATTNTNAKAGTAMVKGDDKGKDSCKGGHDCKGKNDCKGKGGCKSGDNGCKGKNSCKGRVAARASTLKKSQRAPDSPSCDRPL